MHNEHVHQIFAGMLNAFSGELPSASNMDMQTTAEVVRLYRKHVGSGQVDLLKLRDVLRHEVSIIEKGIINVTPGLLTELRAERNYVGRVINEQAV